MYHVKINSLSLLAKLSICQKICGTFIPLSSLYIKSEYFHICAHFKQVMYKILHLCNLICKLISFTDKYQILDKLGDCIIRTLNLMPKKWRNLSFIDPVPFLSVKISCGLNSSFTNVFLCSVGKLHSTQSFLSFRFGKQLPFEN